MESRATRFAVTSGLAFCFMCGVVSADWSQFLGPDRNGVSPEKASLLGGSAAPRWKVPVGPGFGGVAIHGESVFILDRVAGEEDVLRRLNLSDGQEVWRYEYDAPGKISYPGSRSTPATDGAMVYSVGPHGHIKAVDCNSGRLVWEKHLLRDWGSKLPSWGVSQSPLLLGDIVVVAPWGSKASVVAYSKSNGEVAWTAPNPRGIELDYQSVVPMMLDGNQIVLASGRHGYTIGVNTANGRPLFEYGDYNCKWQIPSPTVIGPKRVLLTGGYRAGSAVFEVVRGRNGYSTRTVWANKNLGSHIGQALLYKGNLYANSQDTRGGLRCLSLDGRILWDSARQRRTFERGNLLIAGDLVFIIDGRNGTLYVAQATPEGYREFTKLDVLGGNQVWAPLSYSNGALLIRDQSSLACLTVTGSR